MHNTSWHLPLSNHHEVILFRQLVQSAPFPSASMDCIFWDSMDICYLKARHIWESIRISKQVVNWHIIPWHKLHVPRYSFMLWLGFLGKLQTNDITRAYTGRTLNCQLCNKHPETFSHLFFICEYSTIIITATLQLGGWLSIPLDWTGLTDFISSFQGRKLSKQILSLSLAVSFYKL